MAAINIRELIEQLNFLDESTTLEAKKCREHVDKSFFETVCAFSNEPNLGGGVILLGLTRIENEDLLYQVTGVDDADSISCEIASGCASQFNQPIRPEIHAESIDGKTVLAVQIPEFPAASKPVYFKNRHLPVGAFRRIGASDQHCTEDDLIVFYSEKNTRTLDITSMPGAAMRDIDPDAVERYRRLREKVNAEAEELKWSDEELLQAIGAIVIEGESKQPTHGGILLFGTRKALRRLFPMFRMDYIRVPGNQWIEDPDNRFTTVDMRDTLISLVLRIQDLIFEDLPKEFRLEEGKMQAESITIPVRALREALVNAVMHRDYRIASPIQVIRYTNRIEIRNPGYSLVNEELLGAPGSKTRNPHIASVFHDINLAETKGSGIRTMRRLMEESGFAPPTFESNRVSNDFTSRFLLHHFLDKKDLHWLKQFSQHDLTREQQFALIFVREQGAIDNLSFCQLTELTQNDARSQLRKLKTLGWLESKGKGRASYYVPTPELLADRVESEDADRVEFPADRVESNADRKEFKTDRQELNETYRGELEPDRGEFDPDRGEFGVDRREFKTDRGTFAADRVEFAADRVEFNGELLPVDIMDKLKTLGSRPRKEKLRIMILGLCNWRAMDAKSLAEIMNNRVVRRLVAAHLTPLLRQGLLKHTYPNMINHPRQAYKITEKGRKMLKNMQKQEKIGRNDENEGKNEV